MHYIAVYNKNAGGSSPDQVKQTFDQKIDDKDHDLANHLKQKLNNNIVVISEDVSVSEITSKSYSECSTTIYICNEPDSNFISDKVIYFGVDDNLYDIGDNITFYTLKKIMQIGIKIVIDNIMKKLDPNKKVHLIFDLRIVDKSIAPSVMRNDKQKNYLSYADIKIIIDTLSNKVNYLDILGFNDSIDDPAFRCSKITGELCRYFIKELFNLKEKSMNIFTDDSKFLIYRPVIQKSDKDVGWYIVKFMTLEQRELFINKIGDEILTLEYEDNGKEKEVFVMTTSVREQQEKTYYCAHTIFDHCLFPEEKISMVFELLNTVSSADIKVDILDELSESESDSESELDFVSKNDNIIDNEQS